jgi:1,4-dihydroxy-2-naphthoate octaprenyltransferase
MAANKWIDAARLRTLPLSVSGIIAGSFLAMAHGSFDVLILVFAMLTTIGFQVISNFANDYGDGVKGTDNKDRIGPARTIQSGLISPSEMKMAIKITVFLTLLAAIILIFLSFSKSEFLFALLFFFLGMASIAAAIKYTVGSNAYGYVGLGDLFVFLFFGLLSVCGSYFLYTKSLPLSVFLPAFSIGFLSAGVLNLNNMRDVLSDTRAQKKTLVVKIGLQFAKLYHLYLLLSAFLFALIYNTLNFQSGYQFIFLIVLIPIYKHGKFVWFNKEPKDLDQELKKLALSTFAFAFLFGLGQIL